MVSKGTVCRSVVYDRFDELDGDFVKKRMRIEETRHILTPDNQTVVHIESLNFLRLRGT